MTAIRSKLTVAAVVASSSGGIVPLLSVLLARSAVRSIPRQQFRSGGPVSDGIYFYNIAIFAFHLFYFPFLSINMSQLLTV